MIEIFYVRFDFFPVYMLIVFTALNFYFFNAFIITDFNTHIAHIENFVGKEIKNIINVKILVVIFTF